MLDTRDSQYLMAACIPHYPSQVVDWIEIWAVTRLFQPSHRQDNTYHSFCYTSRGALTVTVPISPLADDIATAPSGPVFSDCYRGTLCYTITRLSGASLTLFNITF